MVQFPTGAPQAPLQNACCLGSFVGPTRRIGTYLLRALRGAHALRGGEDVSTVRLTVVDRHGTVSFLGPGHVIKMLTAVCSRNPTTVNELLDYAAPYDSDFVESVRTGLAIFDEHNTPENSSAFHSVATMLSPERLPPFRVIDELTRTLSLQPVGVGLVLYNLEARRIVQLVNRYGELLRQDRGRIRRGGEPTRLLYSYRLPDDWRILP